MADADMEVLQRATLDAMAFVLAEDADRFGEAIETIVAMGPVAVHSALYAWAVIALQGFQEEQGPAVPGDFWGLAVEDARTGEQVSIDEVRDPAARNAARLVACAGNQDHDTIAAIVQASAVDAETLTSLMVQSVKLAASMAEHLYGQRGSSEEGPDRG